MLNVDCIGEMSNKPSWTVYYIGLRAENSGCSVANALCEAAEIRLL
jgi:hypothetical protein